MKTDLGMRKLCLNRINSSCQSLELIQLMAEVAYPGVESIQLMTQVLSPGIDSIQLSVVSKLVIISVCICTQMTFSELIHLNSGIFCFVLI